MGCLCITGNPPACRQVSLTVCCYLYSWVERDTVSRGKNTHKKTTQMTRPGLKSRPLDSMSSMLTTRPPHLPHISRKCLPCFPQLAPFRICFDCDFVNFLGFEVNACMVLILKRYFELGIFLNGNSSLQSFSVRSIFKQKESKISKQIDKKTNIETSRYIESNHDFNVTSNYIP